MTMMDSTRAEDSPDPSTKAEIASSTGINDTALKSRKRKREKATDPLEEEHFKSAKNYQSGLSAVRRRVKSSEAYKAASDTEKKQMLWKAEHEFEQKRYVVFDSFSGVTKRSGL
jgi:hypothetical protein